MNEQLVKNTINRLEVKELKINISAYARENNVSWITAKNRILGKNRKQRISSSNSKLDNYKEIIEKKLLEYDCTAVAIFYFIKKKGFNGSYSLVRKYVSPLKKELLRKAVLRVETTPGLQAQIDWKEKLTMISKHGEVYVINIFLFILSYSKLKYIELTIDRTQSTLFNCLINAFNYCGSRAPNEIWLDNMKTIVDSHHVQSNTVTFNAKFSEFAKNCMFQPIACRPYRPCTKGLVENLARTTSRLIPYNEEFETLDELNMIVKELNEDLNNEIVQSIKQTPNQRFIQNEKEYLNYVNLDQFITKESLPTRKVTIESMINHKNVKYSVPVDYIDKIVEIKEINNQLYVYYKGLEIACHTISQNYLNYDEKHLRDIIKTTFSNDSAEKIEEKVNRRLKGLDCFVRGGKDDEN